MTQATAPSVPAKSTQWRQLVLGIILMMSISSSQYVWTLFVDPIQKHLGGSLAAIQVTFSIFVVLQTWFSPFQAFLIERFGPRLLMTIGSLLIGASWFFSATVSSISQLYLTYGVLGGIGSGIIYVGVIGLMVRWFPHRRGLATGLVAAGYGAGAILTTFPIAHMIKTSGYSHALVIFGIIQGVVGLIAAQGLVKPPSYQPIISSIANQSKSYRPSEMLRTAPFWLLFVMMSMMSTSGLMIVSEVGPIAKDYGVSHSLVLGVAALPLSLTLSRFTNGITRPFFGWLSDFIGRENTMLIAFSLEALSIVLLISFVTNPALFVVLTGLAFFGWGEIFSLFPSTLTDFYGSEHATLNYGLLYMAQGVGALLGGPLSASLESATGSWTPVFIIVALMDVFTAILAVTVLKQLHKRWTQVTETVAKQSLAE
ncbi:oxalate/formate MFS antiporter [Sulfobacillus thermosulfidooxidans]|uniref:oxalate/formate MFS antiporter n=1 Tax=Sulfobacillus thermosulfidooxidans TaxID=28034 RepID=UPI0002D89E98|nr:oxalate/formate MFS antiporter [Sulfobacillus thermosulfidooxidans]